MKGSELLYKLFHFGISAITLDITGSERIEGLRACTSQIGEKQLLYLQQRLPIFNTNY